jgi:SAM-dependent methyltransferase
MSNDTLPRIPEIKSSPSSEGHFYVREFNPNGNDSLAKIARLIRPNTRVLDLGAGPGILGKYLSTALDCIVDGVELSAEQIQVATPFYRNLQLADLEQVNLTALFSECYDYIVCADVLVLYLKELYRILNQNSLIYVETWNLAHPVGWKRWELEVSNWARSDHSKRKDVARNQFCSPEEFNLYIQGAGLKTIACYTDSPWIQVIAAKNSSKLDIDAIKIALSAKEDKIAYSPLFSELFEGLLEVVSGSKHPKDYLEFLDTKTLNEEVGMYRRYLLAFWSSKKNLWGPLPPS